MKMTASNVPSAFTASVGHPSAAPARLLVVDDHAVVRQGLRDMLRNCPDFVVAAEAADGVEAEALARSAEFDLVVLDIAMPGRHGIEVLESLRASGFTVPVVFFSMYPASQYADYVRRAGGQGFLTKDAGASTVIAALRCALAGGYWFPVPAGGKAGPAGSPFARLSAREEAVMRGLVRGTSASDIAASLGVSPKTVGTYRRRILDKLGVDSNAEMVTLATRHGLI